MPENEGVNRFAKGGPASDNEAVNRIANPHPNSADVEQFHNRSDVDSSPSAQHHTLGYSANQSAPGDLVNRRLKNLERIVSEPEVVFPINVPIGGMIMWPLPDGWPDNFVVADGSYLDPEAYPELFEIYGYTFGESDGLFRSPNMILRMPIGAGLGLAVGHLGGQLEQTLNVQNLPAHTHGSGTLSTGSGGNHGHRVSVSNSNGNASGTARTGAAPESYWSNNNLVENSGAHTHNVVGSTSSTGEGTPFSIVPPYFGLLYLVRAR